MSTNPLLLVLLLLVFSGGQPTAPSHSQDRVPNFELPDLDGRPTRLADVMGENLTLIDFWATWCGPCVKSIPSLVALSDSLAESGVSVVGVNVDSPRNVSKVAPYARSLGVSYPILLDTNSEIMAELNVQAMPTLLVIDDRRNIVYAHEGFRPGDETVVRAEVMHLLSEDR
jgi:thiol-disulfide isomerase/thioredoxin